MEFLIKSILILLVWALCLIPVWLLIFMLFFLAPVTFFEVLAAGCFCLIYGLIASGPQLGLFAFGTVATIAILDE